MKKVLMFCVLAGMFFTPLGAEARGEDGQQQQVRQRAKAGQRGQRKGRQGMSRYDNSGRTTRTWVRVSAIWRCFTSLRVAMPRPVRFSSARW